MLSLLALDIKESFKPAKLVPNINAILGVIIPLAYALAIILFLIILTKGALRFTMAGGSPEDYRSAQSTIKAALLGIIIIALSYALIKAIGYILNADIPI